VGDGEEEEEVEEEEEEEEGGGGRREGAHGAPHSESLRSSSE